MLSRSHQWQSVDCAKLRRSPSPLRGMLRLPGFECPGNGVEIKLNVEVEGLKISSAELDRMSVIRGNSR